MGAWVGRTAGGIPIDLARLVPPPSRYGLQLSVCPGQVSADRLRAILVGPRPNTSIGVVDRPRCEVRHSIAAVDPRIRLPSDALRGSAEPREWVGFAAQPYFPSWIVLVAACAGYVDSTKLGTACCLAVPAVSVAPIADCSQCCLILVLHSTRACEVQAKIPGGNPSHRYAGN